MTRRLMTAISLLVAASLPFAACGDEGATDTGAQTLKSTVGKSDSSVEAVFVDMSFSGSALMSGCWGVNGKIEDQLLYTIGHLNGSRSVGRLDQLELTNVKSETVDGKCSVTYDARFPVAWGKKTAVPDTYTFKLPKDVTYDGTTAFTEKYKGSCVDPGAHDVTSGSMWYYYRPGQSRCRLDAADIVEAKADVSVSPINTTGKYPEFHKIWEDDVLQIVAVFGKYEDGATTSSDAGINAYNTFVRDLKTELSRQGTLVTTPSTIPSSPGIDMPDIVFTAELDRDRSVQVVALLVDNIRTADAKFNERYEQLSATADMIAYNGHAGLGQNVRALANKGTWLPGQYVIVFINGCDSYAYIDDALADAHSLVNSDDPDGTKYLDVVTNALPAYFRSMDEATLAFVRGLIDIERPQTFEQIFENVDAVQVILVSGEQDNVWVPGYDPSAPPVDPPATWDGLTGEATISRDEEMRWETPTLAPGKYLFSISGDGDADLYVRIGEAPSTSTYDCRPYLSGSDEVCEVELPSAAPIHVMVRGYDSRSAYTLSGASR